MLLPASKLLDLMEVIVTMQTIEETSVIASLLAITFEEVVTKVVIVVTMIDRMGHTFIEVVVIDS